MKPPGTVGDLGSFSREAARYPRRAALLLAVSAFAFLLLGFGFYLIFRTTLPAPLAYLHLNVPHFARVPAWGFIWDSLPSFLHVAAFGLLTCALIRPSVLRAFLAGAAWLSVNVLWELSCADHQAWLKLVYQRLGSDAAPICTYDGGDIVAALAGAAVVPLITWFALETSSLSFSSLKEQRR